jgi:hypothetical protein
MNFNELQPSRFGMRVAILNVEMGAVKFPIKWQQDELTNRYDARAVPVRHFGHLLLSV